MMEKQHEHFLSVIREGVRPRVGIDDGLSALCVAEALIWSTHSGSWNLYKDGIEPQAVRSRTTPKWFTNTLRVDAPHHAFFSSRDRKAFSMISSQDVGSAHDQVSSFHPSVTALVVRGVHSKTSGRIS